MAGKDLRKEQVELLRLEKELKSAAMKVAALTSSATVASLGLAHAEVNSLKTALVTAAEKTSKLHQQAEQTAAEQGMRIMEANGTQKDPHMVVEMFKIDLGTLTAWILWVLITGALIYFSTRQSKAGVPILAFIIAMIALWAFALPKNVNSIALYGAFVFTALTAAFNSKSRFIEIGALVLATLYSLHNFTFFFANQDNAIRLVPIINGLAAVYFFWQAIRPKAQQKAFHLILAICQATTLAMSYFHLLTSAIPAAADISSNWMFIFVINRLFDVQILLVIISSRFRVHARKNLSAWALWQEEFFELYAKIKSVLGLGPKPKQD